MSCSVKLCIGFTIIIFNNPLLCDNPFNVAFQEEKKKQIGVQLKLR